MEDFEVIRRFVTDSDFSEEIKEALMQSIAFEVQGKPVSDYLALVKKMAAEH
jgi:hypothetical protein